METAVVMFDGSQDQIRRYNCSSNHMMMSFTSRRRPPAADDDLEKFNFMRSNHMGGCILQPQPPPVILPPPPHCPYSFPPYYVQQKLPPLLPLPPATTPRHATITRGQSCPPVNKRNHHKKTNKSRTKSHTNIPNSPNLTTPTHLINDHLSKDMNNTLPAMRRHSISPRSMSINSLKDDHVDMFLGSGTLVTISPPPSSLPFPSFSLRPKLSCNSKAAVVDTTATDSLRRYLQLR